MSRVECFWMEPVEMARSYLRRYENRSDYSVKSCPANPMGCHDATVLLGDVPYPFAGDGGYGKNDVPHDDPRWPKKCETCDYEFRDEDCWQHNVNRLYRGAPDGKLYTNREMPPGAMYDATWWPTKGPDGRALTVVLPPNGGDDVWHPDMPSANTNTPWTRTGTVPKITCSPSILTPRYHGWLRDGWLESC